MERVLALFRISLILLCIIDSTAAQEYYFDHQIPDDSIRIINIVSDTIRSVNDNDLESFRYSRYFLPDYINLNDTSPSFLLYEDSLFTLYRNPWILRVSGDSISFHDSTTNNLIYFGIINGNHIDINHYFAFLSVKSPNPDDNFNMTLTYLINDEFNISLLENQLTYPDDSLGIVSLQHTLMTESDIVDIPDTAFLYALIDIGVDINEDSLISYAEAEAITSLNVSDRGITDMTGIEAFINLDILDCSKNSLTGLDVSNNAALKVLDVSTNELTSLDVSNNTLLDDLNCSSCLLTSLDVSNNALLEWLSCWNNELTGLDVSNNPVLRALYTQDNPITILDVSNNIALKYLRCRGNLLTRLDVSNNISLKSLSIDEIPTLTCVSVWELPFPPEGVEVDTAASPNVVFITGYCPGVAVENYSQKMPSIYPNPTNDLLTIETVRTGYHSVEINSLNGQLIFSREMDGNSHQIDLSSFQKGIYFITIRSQDFVTTEKIIKL